MESKKFALIKKRYDTIYKGKRLWSRRMVRDAVEKKWITAEEYETIVGEPYEAKE